VDALAVEELLDLLGQAHVVLGAAAAHVRRRDDLVAGQAPHVEVVDGQHAVDLNERASERLATSGARRGPTHRPEQLGLQLLHVQVGGHRLQQDQRRLLH